jgi:hypothetical protein
MCRVVDLQNYEPREALMVFAQHPPWNFTVRVSFETELPVITLKKTVRKSSAEQPKTSSTTCHFQMW